MWLEQKYIGMISNRLDRFKRTKQNEYNFRCPVCGDSAKSKWKARGHLFQKDKGGYLYHCFNCNITLGLEKFLSHVDPLIHQEFVREKIAEKLSDKPRQKTDVELFADKMKPPTFVKSTPLKSLKKISSLAWNHPAKKYIDGRKIPSKYHHKLFYCPRFKEWTNTMLPGKFRSIENDEPRLIIPFIDKEGNLFGYQGRSFSPAGIRYITIMLNDDMPKVYGLDTCDQSKPHYIFEGPIDSMFVDNSIAMAGGSLNLEIVNSNSIFVYDNEPRNVETVKKIEKIIDKGYKVVIFPEHVGEKDINDMVMKGMSVDDILLYNISSGLEAKVILTAWRRV